MVIWMLEISFSMRWVNDSLVNSETEITSLMDTYALFSLSLFLSLFHSSGTEHEFVDRG